MTRTRITTDGIADNAVTDAKIAAVAAAKITGQVATSQVADGAITDAKITATGLAASSVNWQAIVPWQANTAYAKGDLVSNNGIAYRRSTAGTSGATFNATNWQQITPSTIPNTMVTGLGTMSTATAADYLARSGGTMTGQLVVADGTNSAPAIRSSAATNTGINVGSGSVAVVQNGFVAATFASTLCTVNTLSATNMSVDGVNVYGSIFAWVHFTGTSPLNITGTYTRTGNVVTVTTATNHNFFGGETLWLTFNSGGAASGTYPITGLISANEFQVTTAASGTITSGTVTIELRTINSSRNVSSVTRHGPGDYTINFMNPTADGNYAVAANTRVDAAGGNNAAVCVARRSDAMTAFGVRVVSFSAQQATAGDFAVVTVAVIR